MPTALLTGATAGIGHAFAHQLAREGYRLVINARDAGRLNTRRDELLAAGSPFVETLAADLCTPEGVDAVCERISDTARPIDLVVNNAGFGSRKTLLQSDIAFERDLLRIHTEVVLRISHAAAEQMAAHGSGQVINISSVASFLPGGTYSAAKAWCTTFTQGLDAELRRHGASACVVCPGFVRTEFHGRADIDISGIPEWMWLDAADLAREALADARRGAAVSIPSPQYKALAAVLRYAPAGLVRSAVSRLGFR